MARPTTPVGAGLPWILLGAAESLATYTKGALESVKGPEVPRLAVARCGLGSLDRVTVDPRADSELLAVAERAIGLWADFPVDATVRPIVPTQPTMWPEQGFRTGDAKLAFLHGDIVGADDLPQRVLRALRTPELDARSPRAAVPLRVTGVRLSEVAFSTDRGRRTLPAWRIDADDALGPIWVLDPDMPGTVWEAPPVTGRPRQFHSFNRTEGAMLEGDGSTLHFFFIGGPAHRCRYPTVEVRSNGRAVALIPVEERTPLPPGVFETAAGHRREVVVSLSEALGNRVLVDLDGSPVAVLNDSHGPAI